MARNEEKAMAMLSRWVTQKQEEAKIKKPEPHEIETLADAESYRRELIRGISKKIASIQNAGLGEYRLRDLNDEINQLMRTKRYWEHKILEWGGPDYTKSASRVVDKEGVEAPGQGGYRYYGAAKDLPGVRELFANIPTRKPRKTKAELMRHVDADYYGYRDEEDGLLVALEAHAEEQYFARALKLWEVAMKEKEEQERAQAEEEASDRSGKKGGKKGVGAPSLYQAEEDTDAFLIASSKPDTSAAVNKTEASEEDEELLRVIPTQKEIEAMILQRKKEVLIEKYASQALTSQEKKTTAMLGQNRK